MSSPPSLPAKHSSQPQALSALPRSKRQFAVVRLWPDAKAAEHEVIARIKISARSLGLRCVEINERGEVIGCPGEFVSSDNCDFAIHLHFATPKCYDLFSFVALWNPLKFYHDWGYEKFSRNLLSHDDFLSGGSRAADDQVIRLISGRGGQLPPLFNFYPSTPETSYKPSQEEFKLFYIGINWERLSGKPTRHQSLLRELDQLGVLKIYGPEIHQGVNVWEGYAGYQSELPFDGISVIEAISQCGAALVLSSEAHLADKLMSSRVFEALAAGALVICERNDFAIQNFGDTLLYVDTAGSVDQQRDQVIAHLKWANDNPSSARELALRAQSTYNQRLTMTKCLQSIYAGLQNRKFDLREHRCAIDTIGPRVRLFCLLEGLNLAETETKFRELARQTYLNCVFSFVIMSNANADSSMELEKLWTSVAPALSESWNIIDATDDGQSVGLGATLKQCVDQLGDEDFFMLIAPNEAIYSNHVEDLVGSALRKPDHPIYATAAVLKRSGNVTELEYLEDVTFSKMGSDRPIGFARYLIDRRKLRSGLESVLPYLHSLCMGAFTQNMPVPVASPGSVVIDLDRPFPHSVDNAHAERLVLREYAPWLAKDFTREVEGMPLPRKDTRTGSSLATEFRNMSDHDLVTVAGALVEAVLPRSLTRFVFWIYDKYKSL